MKNSLGDLNNHLFAQMERLSDEELKGNKLTEELCRAKAIADISKQIIDNGSLVLKAKQIVAESFNANATLPKMLKGGE